MKQIRKIKELNIWRFFILLLFHFLRFHPPAHLSSLIFQEGCECWESKNSVPEWPWVPRSHTERHHAITAGAMAWEPGSSGSVPRPAADVLCDWEAQSLLCTSTSSSVEIYSAHEPLLPAWHCDCPYNSHSSPKEERSVSPPSRWRNQGSGKASWGTPSHMMEWAKEDSPSTTDIEMLKEKTIENGVQLEKGRQKGEKAEKAEGRKRRQKGNSQEAEIKLEFKTMQVHRSWYWGALEAPSRYRTAEPAFRYVFCLGDMEGLERESQWWNVNSIPNLKDSPGATVDKNPSASAGDPGSIPGPGRLHMLWGN